jgi:hypothetical protein
MGSSATDGLFLALQPPFPPCVLLQGMSVQHCQWPK